MECNSYTFVHINYYGKIQKGIKEDRYFIQNYVIKTVDLEMCA
jgi:hypothetical protein